MIDLRQGDCLEIIKNIPDKSIDCVVTSPPYDNLRDYNGKLNWNFDKFKNIANQLYRVLKDGGVVVWIVNDATIKGSETGTSFRQALYFKEIGFNLHDTMIWAKPTFTAVGALKTRYAPIFEYMFIVSKGNPRVFNPIKDRKNIRAGSNKYGTIRQKDGCVKPMSSIGKKINTYGQRFNIWNIAAEMSNKERCHPAQFPVKLAQDHIISWTNENDTVLDCFMGSGSTGVACVNTNRNFIGIELDEKYFNTAKERITNTQSQIKLDV